MKQDVGGQGPFSMDTLEVDEVTDVIRHILWSVDLLDGRDTGRGWTQKTEKGRPLLTNRTHLEDPKDHFVSEFK